MPMPTGEHISTTKKESWQLFAKIDTMNCKYHNKIVLSCQFTNSFAGWSFFLFCSLNVTPNTVYEYWCFSFFCFQRYRWGEEVSHSLVEYFQGTDYNWLICTENPREKLFAVVSWNVSCTNSPTWSFRRFQKKKKKSICSCSSHPGPTNVLW